MLYIFLKNRIVFVRCPKFLQSDFADIAKSVDLCYNRVAKGNGICLVHHEVKRKRGNGKWH